MPINRFVAPTITDPKLTTQAQNQKSIFNTVQAFPTSTDFTSVDPMEKARLSAIAMGQAGSAASSRASLTGQQSQKANVAAGVAGSTGAGQYATGFNPQGNQQQVVNRFNPNIQNQYTAALQDQISGKMFDPMAAQSRESVARYEANQRAKTAQDINRAGLSGTELGGQVASSAENSLAQNRFAQNIDIEAKKQAMRAEGIQNARAYTNDAQDQAWKEYEKALQIGSDSDVAAAYKAATGKDLDPNSIQEYRGMARDNMSLELEQKRQNLSSGKVAERNAQLDSAMNAVTKQIELLGDNATDEQLTFYAQQYGRLYKEKLANIGMNFSDAELDKVINSFTPKPGQPAADTEESNILEKFVSTTVLDWWENGAGLMYKGQLTGQVDSWNTALEDPKAPIKVKEDAAENMGRYIWAAYQQDSGKKLTEQQKKLLEDTNATSETDSKAEEAKARVKSAYEAAQAKIDSKPGTGQTMVFEPGKPGTSGQFLTKQDYFDIINYEKENGIERYTVDANKNSFEIEENMANGLQNSGYQYFMANRGKIITGLDGKHYIPTDLAWNRGGHNLHFWNVEDQKFEIFDFDGNSGFVQMEKLFSKNKWYTTNVFEKRKDS